MKKILLKPVYSVVFLFSVLSIGTVIYLSWAMYSSDQRQNLFEEIKQVESSLNRYITPKDKNYFDKSILIGNNKALLKTISNIRSGVSKIPLSSFEGKNKIINNISTLEGKIKSNKKLRSEISEIDKNLISFHKLVRTNKWNNLLKITNGAIERVKRAQNSTKLISASKYIETLNKDLNLIYRVAEVSTLSQSKKEIVKNRVSTLRKNQSSVKSLLDEKIVLLKETEDLLKKVAQLIKKISVMKNGNVLAMDERSFVIKKVVWFYSFVVVMFFVSLMLLGIREKKIEEGTFQKRFWHILKNYILAAGKPEVGEEFEDTFLSEILDCRNFIKKNELYGNLLKDTIPEGALIFDFSGDLVWSNNNFREILEGKEIKNYQEFIQFFSIPDVISGSEGFSVSVEKDSQWYTIFLMKSFVDTERFSIGYVKKVNEKKASVNPESERSLVEIEKSLDEVINKNDSVAFDSFVEQSEVPLERIKIKAQRLLKIFVSVEDSFSHQIRELDESSLDNVKVINDIRKIVESFSQAEEFDTGSVLRSSFLSLSSALELLLRNYKSLDCEYQNTLEMSQRNLCKVEAAIESLIKLKKSNEIQGDELRNIIERLADLEIIHEIKFEKPEKLSIEEKEELVAGLVGGLVNEISELKRVLHKIENIANSEEGSETIMRESSENVTQEVGEKIG